MVDEPIFWSFIVSDTYRKRFIPKTYCIFGCFTDPSKKEFLNKKIFRKKNLLENNFCAFLYVSCIKRLKKGTYYLPFQKTEYINCFLVGRNDLPKFDLNLCDALCTELFQQKHLSRSQKIRKRTAVKKSCPEIVYFDRKKYFLRLFELRDNLIINFKDKITLCCHDWL